MSVTVIRHGTIWTGGAEPRRIDGHDLVIEAGVVAEIAPDWRGRAEEEIDATGCLVLPGLINAHVHAGCTPHIRGMTEDAPIPAEGAYYHALGTALMLGYQRLTHAELASLIEWDAIAMLLGGATTIVEENFGGHDIWVELVGRLGFRSDLGLTYPNSVGAIGYLKDGKIVSAGPGDVAAQFQAGLDLHATHHGMFKDRLRIHLSPHGPDTVPEDLLRETRRMSDRLGVNANLHLAQHMNERQTVAARTGGKTSIQYLHDIGFLGPRVMAMHVTFVEPGDIPLLAASGAHVVHGAYRKAKEALISPFWDFVAGGVNVAIATDSFSHDLIQDLRFAAMLAKVRNGDSGTPTARQVLRAATHGAAKALGRPDLGHLEPGARGDVTVVSLESPYNSPVFDHLRSLVYYSGARDIRCTLVDGRVVVREGRVLGSDMDAVARRAREAANKVWGWAEAEGAVRRECC
jgi:cytosine/adenosine deaminase-related metal-dependent hydrolase